MLTQNEKKNATVVQRLSDNLNEFNKRRNETRNLFNHQAWIEDMIKNNTSNMTIQELKRQYYTDEAKIKALQNEDSNYFKLKHVDELELILIDRQIRDIKKRIANLPDNHRAELEKELNNQTAQYDYWKADLLKARTEHNNTRYYEDLKKCEKINQRIQRILEQLANTTTVAAPMPMQNYTRAELEKMKTEYLNMSQSLN